jgi:hypothetical protein
VKPLLWRVAIRDSELDCTAKHVGHVISTYMNGAGVTFVGKETIAKGAGLKSVRAVDNAIDRLEDAGLLTIRRSRGRHPNHYLASTPHPDAGFNPASDDTQPRTAVHSTPHRGAPEVVVEIEKDEVGLRPPHRLIEDDCMKCLERRPLFPYRGRLLCKGCVLEVTGELEAELRVQVEDLATKVASP